VDHGQIQVRHRCTNHRLASPITFGRLRKSSDCSRKQGQAEAMEIRAIKAEDLPQLLKLYRQLSEADLPLPPASELAARWQAFLAHPGLTCLVACDDGAALVASCCVVIVPNLTRGCRPYAVIENVVTDANYRRRGFGSAVIRRALALAWEAGCYKTMLMTGSRRPETLRFYERCGFVSGEKTGFVARPNPN